MTYLNEVFGTIEDGVRHQAANHTRICFESTGLTTQFDKMLENLREDFNVVTIKILCNPEVCIERIKTRDKNNHINVSDDDVKIINREVLKRNHKTDFELNNNSSGKDELIKKLGVILKEISVNTSDNYAGND